MGFRRPNFSMAKQETGGLLVIKPGQGGPKLCPLQSIPIWQLLVPATN
jgi:hypothetical protein